MSVSGIGTAGYPSWHETKRTGSTKSDFGANVKAAGAGNIIHIDPDALFSIHHVETGESANVYRADDYSEDNPVYLVKGIDKNGKKYEQTVDVGKVNPNNCSYTEMLALNAHTGNKSDSNFLTMSILKDKSNSASYHEKADYNEKAFEMVGPNAPQNVKDAWIKAAKEVNANGMGIGENGMMSHISQMMVQRVTKMLKGENTPDILGKTVESAIWATKQALYDLEHPLANTPKSIEVQQARIKEREFYIAFLEKLEQL